MNNTKKPKLPPIPSNLKIERGTGTQYLKQHRSRTAIANDSAPGKILVKNTMPPPPNPRKK